MGKRRRKAERLGNVSTQLTLHSTTDPPPHQPAERTPSRANITATRPTDAVDSFIDRRHRLAPSVNGRSGSGGNQPDARELLAAAATLLDFEPLVSEQPEVLYSAAREYRVLTKQAIELENAAAELREAERQAAMVRRRVQKARRAAERAVQREAQREAGGLYAGEQRSPNRPVHVEVEARAWATVKAGAIEGRMPVGIRVADLLIEAVDRGLPGEKDRGGATAGAGRRAQRFARLFIDEDVWLKFRALALDAGVSAARAVGLVVEREARRLGWEPESRQ